MINDLWVSVAGTVMRPTQLLHYLGTAVSATKPSAAA